MIRTFSLSIRGMDLSAITRVCPSAIAAWEKITSPSESRISTVMVGLLVKAGMTSLIWVHFPWWTPSFSEMRSDCFVVSAAPNVKEMSGTLLAIFFSS